MKRFTVCVTLLAAVLISPSVLWGQVLVKDIWPGGESSAPKEFAYGGGTTFFAAEGPGIGIELWKTDGSEAGTVLIKDINPLGNSDPSWFAYADGLMFFRANDGASGDEVWVSDGSEGGTRLTRDINPGGGDAHPEHIAALGGTVFFMADDGTHGSELWKSDGATTELVMDINPGAGSSSPHWLVEMGGWIYFRADDGSHGEELWKSNGTTAVMVKDVNPGADGSHPERLVVMGGKVYFPAIHNAYGTELWGSDGTEAGTQMVLDINPAGDSEPKHMVAAGSKLFFAAEDGAHGAELWASDGTAGGTELVKDIRAGDSPSLPNNLVAGGGGVYFSANDGSRDGTALWKSNGTEGGTRLVKDVRKSGEPAFQQFTVAGNLYFSANDGAHGAELWTSNGTERGTYLVKDISPGHASAAPLALTNAGGTLYFSASDGLHGRELWKNDGSAPPGGPTARNDEATTLQDTPVNIAVLANDTGVGLSVTQVSDPPHGATVLETDDTVTYTPDPGYNGPDTFTYMIEDIDGQTAHATVSVTVNPTNTLPTISEISDQVTDEDVPTGEIHFTVGDQETPLNLLILSGSADDPVLLPEANITFDGGSGNRSVTLTPAPDQYGATTVTLFVEDEHGGVASTSFLLTVHPVNDAPTVGDIDDQETDEDTPVGPIAFTVDDIDDDDDPGDLTVTATSDNPTLLPDANIALGGSGADRTITLNPASDQAGLATVTVTASDGEAQGSMSFLLTVHPDDAPTISEIPDQVTPMNTSVGPIYFTVDDAQTDPNALLVTATSDNQTVLPNANIILGGSGTDRTITLTPANGQTGEATVTVTAEDSDGNQNNTAFTLTVNPVGVPLAVDDFYIVAEDATLVVDAEHGVLANDIDPDGAPLTAILVEAPEHGTLTLNADGSFTYVPPDHTGEDEFFFTYQASDGAHTSNVATVTIHIGENTPPRISPIDDEETNEDVDVEVTGIIVEDDESHGSQLIVTATSDNQALLPDANMRIHGGGRSRNLAMELAENEFGAATVTVTVSDGEFEAGSSFLLTVHPVNDAPTVSAIADQVTDENTPVGPVAFTVGDVETDTHVLTITATSDNQTLLPDANLALGGSGPDRTITLTPATNQAGNAQVTVTVSDGEAQAVTSFMLTANAVSAPTISDIPNQETNENTPVGPIAFTVDDDQTDPNDLIVTATSDDQTLLPGANIALGGSGTDRTITLTPATDESGEAQVTVVVEDADGNQASTSFTLTVHPSNTAPVAVDDFYVVEGDELVVSAEEGVLANDTDPEGDPLTAILEDPPAEGTLVFNDDGSFTYTPSETHVVTSPDGEDDPLVFTYRASDGTFTSNLATVTLATEHGAGIGDIPDQTTQANVPVGPITFTVTPGHATVEAFSDNQTVLPQSGIELGGNGRNRTITLTPVQEGTVEVTVQASTGGSTVGTTFLLTVDPAGAPTISEIPDQVTHRNNPVGPIHFTVDDDQTPANDLIVTATSDDQTVLPNGNIQHGGNGQNRTLMLTPGHNQVGAAMVTVAVEDDDGHQTQTRFRLGVQETGAPTAVDDAYEVEEGETLVVAVEDGVLVNDTDPDGDPLTAVVEENPAEGTLTLNDDGSFTYEPASHHLGDWLVSESFEPLAPGGGHPPTTFTYRASDGELMSEPATVSISSTHDEDPEISEIPDQETDEDTPTGPIEFTVRPGHLNITASCDNETLVPQGNVVIEGRGPHGRGRFRRITITPAPDQYGETIITLTGQGGHPAPHAQEVTISFTLTVHPVNDAPVALDDEAKTRQGMPVKIKVLANDSDIEGDALMISSITQPANGAVEINEAEKKVVYTPKIDFHGTDTFTYQAGDGSLASNEATVTVTVKEGLADVAILNLEAPEHFLPGRQFTYTATIANLGPENATGVTVVDKLPDDLTFVAGEPEDMCTFNADNNKVRFDLGSLNYVEPQKTFTVSITVVADAKAEKILNTLRVFADQGDPDENNNSVQSEIPIATSWTEAAEAMSEQESLMGLETQVEVPETFSLEPNYPNPFNPRTAIRYGLPEAAFVTMRVYNALGKEVMTLVSRQQAAGWHEVAFDGARLASGLYLYRIEAGSFTAIRKMMLVK